MSDTAASIQAQFDKNHYAIVTDTSGEKFMVSMDEDCNGFYAWSAEGDGPSVYAFTSEDDSDLDSTSDYINIAAEVAAWLAALDTERT